MNYNSATGAEENAMGKEAKREQTQDGRTEQATAHMDAAAELHKRLEAAEINRELAGKRCAACTTVGCWEIYNRERGPNGAGGRVRYVKCKACGHCAQVAVVVKPEGK